MFQKLKKKITFLFLEAAEDELSSSTQKMVGPGGPVTCGPYSEVPAWGQSIIKWDNAGVGKASSPEESIFTASGIPWKQQLKWADCCTPRRFFVYISGGCLPAGNLHSPLPLSVYHQLHLWVEPLTRPNPALRDTGTNPTEENKIWVCTRQSKVWSLPTIFFLRYRLLKIQLELRTWKGWNCSSIPSPFFQ